MKIKNIWRIYTLVIILSLIATICSIFVFINSAKADNNTLDNLITFVVTILSMLIAILAYHISVKTFISIDAVNAISRMDGNVMENVNYRTNIISVIRHFNAKNRDEACNQVLGHLENKFLDKNINSGAKLADSIQEMIDVIVLFSFLIQRLERHELKKSNDNTISRIESLIDQIDKKVTEFEQMSEGSCILIRESVKLLKAVYTYQCYKSGYQHAENFTVLLDVRGTMLKNAISRTIYFNYIGLVYMNKAMISINKYLSSNDINDNSNPDVFSIKIKPLLEKMPNSDEKDLALIYLKDSILNFNEAVRSINDELMWNSFIQYNKARAEYVLSRLTDTNDFTWLKTMNLAVEYRSKLVVLLDDILGSDSKSYLQRAFYDQLKMAQMMNIRLQLATGKRDVINPDDLQIGQDEFLRLRHIKEDIMCHFSN